MLSETCQCSASRERLWMTREQPWATTAHQRLVSSQGQPRCQSVHMRRKLCMHTRDTAPGQKKNCVQRKGYIHCDRAPQPSLGKIHHISIPWKCGFKGDSATQKHIGNTCTTSCCLSPYPKLRPHRLSLFKK